MDAVWERDGCDYVSSYVELEDCKFCADLESKYSSAFYPENDAMLPVTLV